MKFSDITGHEEVVASLRHQADERRLPHAILLSGAAGIGKMRLARALSQYVHCSHHENGDSCGKCASCLQHQSLNNPDMHYVYPVIKEEKREVSGDYAEEWKEMLEEYPYMPEEKWSEILLHKSKTANKKPLISVKEAEELLTAASLSPFKEDYKIFLIWLPEKMNEQAANKLLKLLEEPFEDTLFILVSNSPMNLLPTIFSRTQRYTLKPLPTETLSGLLEKEKGIDRQTAYELARLSEGSISRALELAEDAGEQREFGEMFRSLMRMSYSRQLGGLKRFADTVGAWSRPKTLRFLEYCGRMIRENFIYNLKINRLTGMTPEEKEFARKFAPFIHTGNVEKMSEEISKAERDVVGNANVKIVIFSMSLIFCQLIRTTKPS